MNIQIEERIKQLLRNISTDEQMAIAQILLSQINLDVRYVSLKTLDCATPAVKEIEVYFEGSDDSTRLGMAATIVSAIFTSLVGRTQQESPTSEFQKNFLGKMLSDKATALLEVVPFNGIEAEVQLLDNFLRGVWRDWQSTTGADVNAFVGQNNEVFWLFVVHNKIGDFTQRDRLFNYLREK